MNRIVFCLFLSLIIDLGYLFELIAGRDRINNYALKQSVLYFILLSAVPDFCTFFFSSILGCAAVCFQRVELYILVRKTVLLLLLVVSSIPCSF